MLNTFNKSALSFQWFSIDEILNDATLSACVRGMTLHSDSGMNRALNYYQNEIKNRPLDVSAVLAKYNGNYIGWLMLTKENDAFYFKKAANMACAQIYVMPAFRRNKVGTCLIEQARIKNPTDKILVYDNNNYPFFTPFVRNKILSSILY